MTATGNKNIVYHAVRWSYYGSLVRVWGRTALTKCTYTLYVHSVIHSNLGLTAVFNSYGIDLCSRCDC